MQKIYKYRLPRDGQVITIREVVQFLHVGAQDGYPTLWAIVDDDYATTYDIVAWGTGWELPKGVWPECEYIGTCEDCAGYVWHYFAQDKTYQKQLEELAVATSDAEQGLWEMDANWAYLPVTVNTDTVSTTNCGTADSTVTIDWDLISKLASEATEALRTTTATCAYL